MLFIKKICYMVENMVDSCFKKLTLITVLIKVCFEKFEK